MALISFGYRVDMQTIAPPTDPAGYIVAYDLDGILKQKNHLGVVSLVGGSVGLQGPPGPVGPAGLTWSGYWIATQSYLQNYAVGYASASWWCISDIIGATTNPGPDVDTIHWALLAAQGSPGLQGGIGLQGSQGSRGEIGINWRGDWIINVYDVRDAVYYEGSSYFCITSTVGTETLSPDNNTTCWKLIALKGANGLKGATGSDGPQDSTGSILQDIFYNIGGTVSATNSTASIYRTGPLSIGTSGVSASLHIKGTSSIISNNLLLENSSNTQLLKVLNNGQIILGDNNASTGPSGEQGVFIVGQGTANYGSNTSNPNLLTFIVGSVNTTFVSGIQGASLNIGNVRSGIYFTNNASDIVFRAGYVDQYGTQTAQLQERMRIGVSGNVNINSATAMSGSKLFIQSSTSSTTIGSNVMLDLYNGDSGTFTSLSEIAFSQNGQPGASDPYGVGHRYAIISGYAITGNNQVSSGGIKFSTRATTGSNLVTSLVVAPNGSVYNEARGSNTLYGLNALLVSTGINNTAIGGSALQNNLGGLNNTAVGLLSMASNTSGNFNTAVGLSSLYNNDGDYNTAVGYHAGHYIGSGVVGATQSNWSTYIGSYTSGYAYDTTHEVVIGASAVGNGSYSVTLGNDTITKTILKGNIGVGTASPTNVLDVVKNQAGSTRINIENTNATGISTLRFSKFGGAAAVLYENSTNEFTFQNATNGGTLRLQTTTSVGATNTALTINSNQNIGIGMTTPTSKLEVTGSITASSSVARGISFTPTLISSANNDVLIGLDISPTFSNGTFSSVTNISLRVTGNTTANSFIKSGDTDANILLAGGGVTPLSGFLTSVPSLQQVTDINSSTTTPITANSFIKSGGTSSQFLKADGSVDSSDYAKKTITVRKISTATTLQDSDNATVILATASCTVTLPNNLMTGFNVSFATQTGATLTYSLGNLVTLINNSGLVMPPQSSHTLVNTGVSNEYLTVGL